MPAKAQCRQNTSLDYTRSRRRLIITQWAVLYSHPEFLTFLYCNTTSNSGFIPTECILGMQPKHLQSMLFMQFSCVPNTLGDRGAPSLLAVEDGGRFMLRLLCFDAKIAGPLQCPAVLDALLHGQGSQLAVHRLAPPSLVGSSNRAHSSN